jgi:3-hydroxybutyryl-CoA dehydrogenase
MLFLCKKSHMKVLVLADDELKSELMAHTADPVIQFQWINEPAATDQYARPDACIDLLFENNEQRIQWLKQLQAPLTIINSVITPLKELQADFVRVNAWKTFLSRNSIEASCHNEALKQQAEELFSYLGRRTEWVPDVAGFITPRVVASVINEAFLTLEENVSAENEIDTAMKLGTNYPFGPFEWGEKIGLDKVYSLLEALTREQIRYKPSLLLRQKILV